MRSSLVATKVYNLVASIPRGKVLTYGSIARALQLKTPRQVGWLLHRNDDPQRVPCHRVVFSDGSLSGNYAFGGIEAQRKWLESEGVIFNKNRVDLKHSLWRGN